MTDEQLLLELNTRRDDINRLVTERKQIAWQYGVPNLIAKMKRFGISSLQLIGNFDDGELSFNHDNKYCIAKNVKLTNEDELIIVYTTWWEVRDCDIYDRGHGSETYETLLTQKIANRIFPTIMPILFKSDYCFIQSANEGTNE